MSDPVPSPADLDGWQTEFANVDRAQLERYAERVTSQLQAVVDVARHWNDASLRLVEKGYIAPFRYSPEDMAQTIRQAIFWADWPSTEHRDILAEKERTGD